jgi:hypothetical protein
MVSGVTTGLLPPAPGASWPTASDLLVEDQWAVSVCHDIAEGVLAWLLLGPSTISDVLDWYSITPSKFRRHMLDIVHRSIDPVFPLPERLILVTLHDYGIEPCPDALRLLGELWMPDREGRTCGEWNRLARELYLSLPPRSGSILLAASAIAQYAVTPTPIRGYCIYRSNGTTSALVDGEKESPGASSSHPVVDALIDAILPWARISSNKVRRAIHTNARPRGTRHMATQGGSVLHLILRTPNWDASETGPFDIYAFHYDALSMYLAGSGAVGVGPGLYLSIQGLLSVACARSYLITFVADQAAVRCRLQAWGFPVQERT